MKSFSLIAIIVALILAAVSASSGFDSIPWITSLDDAKEEAKKNGKPIAVLFTEGFCGACKRLKASFVPGKDMERFEAVASKFNIVHLSGAKNLDSQWKPDGGYIPRLIIADTEAHPLLQFDNGKEKHKYFPGGSVGSFADRLFSIASALGK